MLYCHAVTGRLVLIACFLFIYATAQSQLCQGSLGDPIINITFGSGTNPGPPLAAVQGSQYQGADCPNDGFYSVRNSTNNCFTGSWHTISSDHTGNTGGYFMLINASFQPSIFYLDTVRGLCGGTTYEFAAWLMNVQKPTACNGNVILPNVTFSIEKTDGTVIQSYNTNNIPGTSFPTWRQYGFFFATPAAVADVVLRITNNAPGGCGNDIALDDITFRPCGPQLTASIVGATADTVNTCEGTARTVQFTASASSSSGSLAYQWQQRSNGGNWTDIAGATSTTYSSTITTSTAAGVYEYRMGTASAGNIATQRCRIYSRVLAVVVNATPAITLTASGPACAGKRFLLKATGGNIYSWTGPNGFTSADSVILFANIQPAQNGNYTVVASSTAGCSATSTFTITVNPSVAINTSFSDTTVCQKARVQLNATGGNRYQWLPATGLSDATIANPIATALDTIRYQIVTANSFGCTDTAYINLNVVKLAIANAGPDKTVLGGTMATLEGSIQNPYAQFYWQPSGGLSNVNQLQPLITSTSDAVYWLTAVSPNNCGVSIDTVSVKFFKDIFIPSAFTPNGDGKNDRWSIPTLQAFSQYHLQVFSRYGQLLFETRNQYQPWNGTANGTPLPSGTYVYFLTVAELKKSWKGTVVLIR